MSSGDDILASVLCDAAKPGEALAPFGLLAAAAAQPNPFRAHSDTDQALPLFEAFEQEFDFIRYTRAGKLPSAEERERWASLIRWLTMELGAWKCDDDLQYRKLTALFIVTQSCDWSDQFWTKLPDSIGVNLDLVEALRKLIATLSMEVSTRGAGPGPIWENEELDAFRLADEQGDWVTIADKWRLFEGGFFPKAFQTQMVRCLCRYCFKHLVRALHCVCQTPIAMQVALALSVEQRLRLAIASNNRYVQFSCAFQTIAGRMKPQQLSLAEQQILTELLLEVANDDQTWLAWMLVFNHYPPNNPVLQIALGHALAQAPDSAVESYISSIDLSLFANETRRYVADCLRSFRGVATPERSCTMWISAYKRWSAWRFDQTNRGARLLKITWSELDYAVVGYAIECMDDAGREEVLDAICAQLSAIRNSWHASVMDCITDWNRLLSQLQPYAHAAEVIRAGGDWLTETKNYQPSFLSDAYLRMMFSVA